MNDSENIHRAERVAATMWDQAFTYVVCCSKSDQEITAVIKLERLHAMSLLAHAIGLRWYQGVHVNPEFWTNYALDMASRHLNNVGGKWPLEGATPLDPYESRQRLADVLYFATSRELSRQYDGPSD